MVDNNEVTKVDPTISSELTSNEDVVVMNKEEVKTEESIKAQPRKASFKISYPGEHGHYIKMLIYGKSGVGKTTLAGSAQDVIGMKNVLNIDAEGGSSVLESRGDIPSIQVRKFSEFQDIFEYLSLHCKLRDKGDIDTLRSSEAYFRGVNVKTIKEPSLINTVVIDSLSEVARYCMYDLLGVDIEKTRLDQIPIKPEYTNWNAQQEMIRLLIRKFRDLKMNVIFICSRNWDKNEVNQFLFTPNLQGKLAGEVLGFMDHVAYMVFDTDIETKENHRYLMLQPGRTFEAKNRFTNFKNTYLMDPIMQDLYDLQIKNKTKKGDK
jgi:DNA polymerase III delta prime subunit